MGYSSSTGDCRGVAFSWQALDILARNSIIAFAALGVLAPGLAAAEPADQRVLFVGSMSLDAGRWGLAYDHPLGGPLRAEAGAAFTNVYHDDGMTRDSANGAAGWLGATLAWTHHSTIDGMDSLFEASVTLAPAVTVLSGGGRRLSLIARPGFALGLGRFAFRFGFVLEIPAAQTAAGPFSDDPLLPGVSVGLGVRL